MFIDCSTNGKLNSAYWQSGYTLLEVVVVVGLIGFLAALTGSAFPIARSNQALNLAEQQLQAALREAQQIAITEERSDACIAYVANSVKERFCSDVGVYVEGNRLLIFADTTGDNLYTVKTASGGDFLISDLRLPSGVEVVLVNRSVPPSFVFHGEPPTVVLLVDGQEQSGETDFALQSGNVQANYKIYSYGQVERTN